jgi:hypothetical protein
MPQKKVIRNRMSRARVKRIRIRNVALHYADNLMNYLGYWGFQCNNTIFTQMQGKKFFNSSPENQGLYTKLKMFCTVILIKKLQ